MSFRHNVAANYLSQAYVTLAGIVVVPWYLKHMGPEAYGLIGFFAMVQAWFALLDIGLTPTLARETARSKAGAVRAVDYRRLVRALTMIFVAIAILGSAVLFFGAPYLAEEWLGANVLPIEDVRRSLELLALGTGVRWLSGLARARIAGAEAIVWLSAFNALVATIRFGGAIPVFVFIDTKPDTFFAFQLIVAIGELVILNMKAHALLPRISSYDRIGWSLAPIRGVLKFSLAVAFTSSLWVLVTQTDKLLLSKMLSLESYGYYSLAIVIAGSVLIATGPISLALIPRLSSLVAQGDAAGLQRIYSRATRLVSAIAFSVGFVLAAFAEPVVWAWTGDVRTAQEIAPVLQLYSIGNAVMAVSAFPAYLQFAEGKLRLHVAGTSLFILVLLPALLIGVSRSGAVGAGWAWLFTNTMYLTFWVPVVHRKFAPGTHQRWLWGDVLTAATIAAGAALLMLFLVDIPHSNRVWAGAIPVSVGLVVLFLASLPLLWNEISLSVRTRAPAR